MPAMLLTAAQFRNRLDREAEVKPKRTYHSRLGPGDQVSLTIVSEEPATVRRVRAVVESVAEHGWYSDVTIRNGGPPETVRLFRDGPPDWGAVECTIVEPGHRPLRPFLFRY